MNEKYQEFIDAAKGMIYIATAVDDQPSLRGVGFSKSNDQENLLYIVTNPASPKVAELKNNSKVAFTTPIDMSTGMRMSSNRATLKVSEKKWADVQELFTNPGWHAGHPHPENEIVLELSFPTAVIQSFVIPQTEIKF